MDEWINEHLDEKEEEWNQPIGERLLKMVIVGAVSVVATSLASAAYDKAFRKELEESNEEQTES